MPNRMLRDWTQSDKINGISAFAERFFVRLIMKADDYGCFWGDTRLLKANLYPLLLDNIREADLTRWMAECQKAGLIVLYEVNSKKYVQIIDFGQRLDKARPKFPLPDEKNKIPEIVNGFPAELETELELEPEKKCSAAKLPPPKPVVKKKKEEEPPEPYWQQLVDTWFTFGKEKFNAEPSFTGQDPKIFKRIIHLLKKRAEANKVEWNQDTGPQRLRFFLDNAWQDDWLSKHFLLKNLETQFDTFIQNQLKAAEEKKQQSATMVSLPVTDQKITKELDYLYGRYLENGITVISIEEQHYNHLKKTGQVNFSDEEVGKIKSAAEAYMQEKNIEPSPPNLQKYLKKFGVMEYFFKKEKLDSVNA